MCLLRLMPVYVGLKLVSCLFLSVPQLRAECKAACRLHLLNLNRRNIGIVEDSKTSRNMCEDLLGYSHKQAK